MPGKKITQKQVSIYMENRKNGKTQQLAAAKAGISERSGRDIDHNKLQPQKDAPRTWETRKSPFKEVWETDVVPMLKQGIKQATFVLEKLEEKYPGKFCLTMLRSLQRKIKKWRALFGANKEVMFRQVHKAGKLGISDFTHPKDIEITINGEPLEHIFYRFRLPYSGFNYTQVFKGSGEPFDAFAQGLQEALQSLGGVPEMQRTDSLAASFKNLNKEASEDITERYKAFVEHYGMQATRINPGKGHENGAIESSHGHFKNRVRQSLIVRSSNDFTTFEEYRKFIQMVTKQHNHRNAILIEEERATLKALPVTKAIEYTEVVAVVSSSSTIDVKRVTYSVPSRLIGETLLCRVYNDKLECYLGSAQAAVLKRMHNPARGQRGHQIDYHDIISSLVKKPGAFRGSKLRNAILPNEDYRFIWEHVSSTMNYKDAGKFIVGLLHMAATYDCEAELAQEVMMLIESKKLLKLTDLQNKFNKHKQIVPAISVPQHELKNYNDLIPNCQWTSND